MSESTFRAVVASVLVGALALAVLVASVVLLQQSPRPSPSVTGATVVTPGPTPTSAPTPTVAPTRSPGPVFSADVVSVGLIPRGGASAATLVLRFLELGVDAIPDAAGSFRVTLTDAVGDGTTVAFVGTPSIVAPGSLGVSATLAAPGVLQVEIAGSDPYNVELMTISGLGISASSSAAPGPVHAELGEFTGSLATGATGNALASPGTVIANP